MNLDPVTFEDLGVRQIRHNLRGALNALHLSLRVLEQRPPEEQGREFSRYVLDSAEKVERLLRELSAAEPGPLGAAPRRAVPS